jgi:hypothetical protein
MPWPELDRASIKMKPLAERTNKKSVERDFISPDTLPGDLPSIVRETLAETIERIVAARKVDRPVILAFGAHTIKNGLAPVLIGLMQDGWLTHLATNGAGIIHDWEFAFQGQSSEDVKTNVEKGWFGNWEETGFYINLALVVGAAEGKGYGESVGSMIENEGLTIPDPLELVEAIKEKVSAEPDQAAANADLLGVIRKFNLTCGPLAIPHPFKQFSAQAAAFRLGVRFTGHPMIGHDIIYTHPMNHGGALGRAALRDFLTYAQVVSRIDGGVYLSIGSAVMSPMIFEKSLSMSQNLAIQHGEHIDDHYILVADLAQCDWDWRKGEPPEDDPAYYLRYNKSFSRMGGQMRYVTADNRDILLLLSQGLRGRQDLA